MAKIHSRPHILLQPQSLTVVNSVQSVNTTPTEGLHTHSDDSSPATRKVSRFQVSVIPESESSRAQEANKRDKKTGRFSVVTHEEEEEDLFRSPTTFYTTGSALLLGTTSSPDLTSSSTTTYQVSFI